MQMSCPTTDCEDGLGLFSAMYILRVRLFMMALVSKEAKIHCGTSKHLLETLRMLTR